MPFTFSKTPNYDAGRVMRYDVPLMQYLGASWDEGVHAQIFSSVSRFTEDQLFEGPNITADKANEMYGIPDELTFKTPVSEERARAMRSRKESEMMRNYILSNGAPGGLFSGRGLVGLGASTVANIMSPTDLAINFLPIVGSESAALKASSLGRGATRQYLARGLVTEESLAKYVPYPRFAGSVVNGSVGAMASDVPHLIQSMRDQEHYGLNEFAINFGASAILAGALHIAVKSVEKLATATREAMFRKSIDQTLKGEDVSVHDLVRIDEGTIRDKVKFDEEYHRERALLELAGNIKEHVKNELNEYPVQAALRNPRNDEVRSGVSHWLIDITDWDAEGVKVERGFITNRGRYVPESEGAALQGKTGPELMSEELPGNLDLKSDPEIEQFYTNMVESGATHEEAMGEVRKLINNRQEEAFFSKPEVQKLVDEETARQVNEYVQNEREKHDEKGLAAEVDRQIAQGKTLTPEMREKWRLGDTPEKDAATLKEQEQDLTNEIKDLEDELKDELKKSPNKEKFESLSEGRFPNIDKMIESLESAKVDLKGKSLEGITGMPVWLWNGAIDATIGALRAGKKAAEAVEEGIKHIRSNYKSTKFSKETAKALRENREIYHGTSTPYYGTKMRVPKKGEHFTLSAWGENNYQALSFSNDIEMAGDYASRMSQSASFQLDKDIAELGKKRGIKGNYDDIMGEDPIHDWVDKVRSELMTDGSFDPKKFDAFKKKYGIDVTDYSPRVYGAELPEKTKIVTLDKVEGGQEQYIPQMTRENNLAMSEGYEAVEFHFPDSELVEYSVFKPENLNRVKEYRPQTGGEESGTYEDPLLSKIEGEFRKRVTKTLVPKKSGVSRRTFLDSIGRVTSAMGLTPANLAMDLLKNVGAKPMEQVKKLLLPNVSFRQLSDMVADFQSSEGIKLNDLIKDLKKERPQDFGDSDFPKIRTESFRKATDLQNKTYASGNLVYGENRYFLHQVFDNHPEVENLVKQISDEEAIREAEAMGLMDDELPNDPKSLRYQKISMLSMVSDFEGSPPGSHDKLLEAALNLREKIMNTPLSELESGKLLNEDIINTITSGISDLVVNFSEVARKINSLIEPEAAKIATKAIDVEAKSLDSAIESAVLCLTNLKI